MFIYEHEYFGSLAQLTWSPKGFTFFARDPKYSWFHEHSKNGIHFLNKIAKMAPIYCQNKIAVKAKNRKNLLMILPKWLAQLK